MPILALYYIAQSLKNYTSSDQLLSDYQKYSKTPIISIDNVDKDILLSKIKENYNDYEQKYIDGVSVFGQNFRFNVRPSNTEPKLKYTLEADTLEIMNQEQEKLEKLLRS